MRFMSAVALTVFCIAPSATAAQTPPRYTVERLAEGIHALLYTATDTDVEGNTLIVINEDDVVVVDTNSGASFAKATIAEIKKLTSKPVRYVVNTHWHDDHVIGNHAYAEAYPGVQFIAHPLTRQDILEHAFANNAFVIDLIEADIARISGALESGTFRDKPLTPAQRTRFEKLLAGRHEALADRKVFRPAPPTIDVADSMTLRRGSREIQIRYLGRGNTRGDLVVYLPAEKIVATGDLVVYPVPYATNSYALEWPRTLDRLMALPAATILPGHGPVMRDWTYVQQVKSAIEMFGEAVSRAKHEGRSLAETQKQLTLTELRATFAKGDSIRAAGWDAFFRPTLIRSLWEELDPAIMAAYAKSTLRETSPDVFVFGPSGDSRAWVTAYVNEKDIVLVSEVSDAPAAWAAVRALREQTDKPVRHVVLAGEPAAQKPATDVFREAYTQADVISASPAGTGVVVTDAMTLHSGDRTLRVRRARDGLVVDAK